MFGASGAEGFALADEDISRLRTAPAARLVGDTAHHSLDRRRRRSAESSYTSDMDRSLRGVQDIRWIAYWHLFASLFGILHIYRVGLLHVPYGVASSHSTTYSSCRAQNDCSTRNFDGALPDFAWLRRT